MSRRFKPGDRVVINMPGLRRTILKIQELDRSEDEPYYFLADVYTGTRLDGAYHERHLRSA